MRRILPLLALLACSSSSKKDIAPEVANPDGGNVNSSAPGTDTSVSGSRLKARRYNGEDGSMQFTDWYDSQRQENCSFRTAADGKLRCMPSGSAAIVVSNTYSDEHCTMPIAIVPAGCATGLYVSQATLACSAVSTQLFAVGARYTPSASAILFTATDPTHCGAATVSPGVDYYSVGAEVAPSSFVAATETHD